MKVYRLTGGGSAGLKISDEEPSKPQAGQVLVRMRAFSINYRDSAIAKRRGDGLIPLSDGAGEIVEVGPGVSRWKVGDRVAGTFYQTWLYGPMKPADFGCALGGSAPGVLSEFRVFDSDGLVSIPASLSWGEAATLPCAGLTAWQATRDVHAGDTVLILGTGGVSLFALQFALAAGAKVIATSSSDDKLNRLRELGAETTVNYRTSENWDEIVKERTNGSGVDHVIEVGGGGTLPKSISASRVGGTIQMIGVLAGGTVDPMHLMLKGLILKGIQVGSRQMFEDMNRLVEVKKIAPVICKSFPFEDARSAYDYLDSKGHFGKITIEIR